MDAEPFIAAGVYDPAAPRAAERWELIEHLLARGITNDQVIQVARQGALVALAASLAHDLPQRISITEAAEKCGSTVDEIAQFWAALGFTADDRIGLPETFCSDFALYRVAADQFGSDATLEFARLVGACIARLMEGGRVLFSVPLQGRQPTELEISQANEVALAAWYELAELVRHLMIEWARTDVEFQFDLLRGDISVGIAFVDLVGSTAWANSIPASEHSTAVARFEALASEQCLRHGARPVKFIGDEVMIAAREPLAAAEAAAALCEAVGQDRDLPPARGAVGYGVVKARSGDYFGDLVNLVARAAKIADPDGIVVTGPVVEHLDPNRWQIGTRETTALRGLNEPIELFRVARLQRDG